MNCYLCDSHMPLQVTWRSIFFNELEEVICKRCRNSFERTVAGCPLCSARVEGKCLDCCEWETTEYKGIIDSGKSLYHYNSAMKEYLHQYKFLQDVALSEVFATLLKEQLRDHSSVIVPIPMNEAKLRVRTFSQVDRLLDAASIPYTQLLGKSEVGIGDKPKLERMALQDVFWWNGKPVPEKILLFDDVYTTGSTMRLAAKVLKDKGAKEIKMMTLIRA
ncbi:ComF family protein [Planococcus sp. S3-L1]|uniref:ComF family protein n=1 Tax=Planococcus sp. S3-L1 TaxID=3046200 RepID=UPI0024BA61E0|nr:ComF family protein [Planococcus sp. S3-L1]MDJ0330563.1 ComF family protein [Planococcus sp. S3-L1]